MGGKAGYTGDAPATTESFDAQGVPTISSAMTTAPMTADFAKTVNAVGIGSSAWLERPARIINKIKAMDGLKINVVLLLTTASGCRSLFAVEAQ
jgi:hypothetical protein